MDDGKGQGHSKRPQFEIDEDMLSLEDLKREADIACEIKGHMLENWQDYKENGRIYSSNGCAYCMKGVTVCETPSSNEKDIAGEAFTSSCAR